MEYAPVVGSGLQGESSKSQRLLTKSCDAGKEFHF